MTPKKILFAAEFWGGATGAGLASGLRKLGHEVIELDWRTYFGADGLAARVLKKVTQDRSIMAFNRAILAIADEQRPDIFLTVKGNFISKQTIMALQRKSVICVNFYPDFSFDHPGISIDALTANDLVATTKSFQLDWLQERMGADRVTFVHHGYVPAVHRPVGVPMDENAFEWDICYIGNPSPFKRLWLESVCTAFAGRRIVVAGNAWNRFAGSLRGATILPAALNEDFARLTAKSRINLAIHYGRRPGSVWEDNVSTRSFEVPACKGFMLHVDNHEIRSLYEVGREIDVFTTAEQLQERIRFYLDHPRTRQAMIEAAYARAVPEYSLDRRARELMAAIGKLSKPASRIRPIGGPKRPTPTSASKRILFVAEFWQGATGAGMAHGLRSLGHDVTELDWRATLLRHGSSAGGKFVNRLLSPRLVADFNRSILDIAEETKPDVMLTLKGVHIGAKTISGLQAKGVFCANFYPDVAFSHPGVTEEGLKAFDLIVTTKRFHLDWLTHRVGEDRRALSELGYSTDIHVPIDMPECEEDYDWDIAYVGNPSTYKKHWLESVCRAFPDKRIAIVGHRWPKFLEGIPSNVSVLPARLAHDYARIVSRSRINLGIHYGPAGPQGWEDAISGRSFHIPACKGFMLHIDNPEIRALYERGREIDVFSSKAELVEKIGYYLGEPGKRAAMIEAAYLRCVPAYSLDMRAIEVMDAIGRKQRNDHRPLAQDITA